MRGGWQINLLPGQRFHQSLLPLLHATQVQRMKLDSVAAMLKLDQILKATELSLSVVAALPGLAFTWMTLSSIAR